MRLIADPRYDAEIAAWCAARMGQTGLAGALYGSLGVLDDYDTLVAAAILHNWTKHDMELTFYGPGFFSVSLARVIADIVFVQAGCGRCTLRVPRRNKRVLRALPRLGWTHEGIQRRLCGPTKADDAILFGLLRSDAGRWLRIEDHGAEARAA